MKSLRINKNKPENPAEETVISPARLELAKYTLKVMLSELSKFLLLLVFFHLAGKAAEFITATVILILIRSFSGGLHFRKYWACLAFTTGFYIAVIYFPGSITGFFAVPILTWALIVLYFYSPVQSPSRPAYSYEKNVYFRSVSILALISVAVGLLMFPGPMDSVILSAVLFQTTQVIIAKEVNKSEKDKKIAKAGIRTGISIRSTGPDADLINQ